MITVLVHIVLSSFHLLLSVPFWVTFWFLFPPEALGAEELQAVCPPAQPQGSTAAGAGNLAGRAGMWSHRLSPGMQIYYPRGMQSPTLSG